MILTPGSFPRNMPHALQGNMMQNLYPYSIIAPILPRPPPIPVSVSQSTASDMEMTGRYGEGRSLQVLHLITGGSATSRSSRCRGATLRHGSRNGCSTGYYQMTTSWDCLHRGGGLISNVVF